MAEKLDEVCDRTYTCHPQFKTGSFLDQKAIFTTGFTIGNSYAQDRIKPAIALARDLDEIMTDAEKLLNAAFSGNGFEKHSIGYKLDYDEYHKRRRELIDWEGEFNIPVVFVKDINGERHYFHEILDRSLLLRDLQYSSQVERHVIEYFESEEIRHIFGDELGDMAYRLQKRGIKTEEESLYPKITEPFTRRLRFEKMIGGRRRLLVQHIVVAMISDRHYINRVEEEIIKRFEREEQEEMNRISAMDCANINVNIGGIDYNPSSVTVEHDEHPFRGVTTKYTIEVDAIARYVARPRPATDYSQMHGKRRIPEIKKVIFNDPATVVLWADGTKTVVKCENEAYDPEKGLTMAIAKKALGNQGNYFETIKKWKKEYAPKIENLNVETMEFTIEDFNPEAFKDQNGLLGTTKDGMKIFFVGKKPNDDKPESNGDGE